MVPTSPTVTADFLEDLRLDVTRLLNEAGVSVPEDADVARVCHLFLNLKRRQIEPAQRTVHRSKELNARKLSPIRHTGVALVSAKSTAGQSLMGHLSTNLEKADHYDMLLNDWGVHHLHLGLGRHPKQPGYTNRTKELLFVLVRPSDLYLIDVLPHPGDCWVNEQLVEILHQNWPAAIEDRRMPNVMPVSLPSREMRAALRASHLNTIVFTADGTAYHLGGFVSSGLASIDGYTTDRILTDAQREERACREEAEKIAAAIAARGSDSPAELRLRRRLVDGRFKIVEEHSGLEVRAAG